MFWFSTANLHLYTAGERSSPAQKNPLKSSSFSLPPGSVLHPVHSANNPALGGGGVHHHQQPTRADNAEEEKARRNLRRMSLDVLSPAPPGPRLFATPGPRQLLDDDAADGDGDGAAACAAAAAEAQPPR